MIIFTLLSAVLSLFIFPPYDLNWLSYIFLIPLLFDLFTCWSPREGFYKMGLFGFIMMAHFHSWIIDISPWATSIGAYTMWIALSLYHAFFFGIMGRLVVWLRFSNTSLLILPSAWVLLEWIRTVIPFGSAGGILGYTQVNTAFILEIAPFFGVFGISFLCIFINVLLYKIIFQATRKDINTIWFSCVSLFVLFFIGIYFSKQSPTLQSDPLSVAIVQGNHTQYTKLNRLNWNSIVSKYFSLSAPYWDQDIVLWPENLIPRPLSQDTEFERKVTQAIGSNSATLIVGLTEKKDSLYYNGISLFNATGRSSVAYQKEKLMPFGEYIPFRSFFSTIGPKQILSKYVGFSHGSNPTLQSLNQVPFSSAVCLESCFASPLLKQTKNGGKFLVVGVNTAWFTQRKVALQHLYSSQMRALELSRYLIQSSNNGYSAIISPKGSILHQTHYHREGVITGNIYPIQELSFYSKYPNLLPILLILYLLYLMYNRLMFSSHWSVEQISET